MTTITRIREALHATIAHNPLLGHGVRTHDTGLAVGAEPAYLAAAKAHHGNAERVAFAG